MAYILISCPYSERCYFNLRSLRSVEHWNMREGEYNCTFIARLHKPNQLEKEPDKLQEAWCLSNYVYYKAWIVLPKCLTEINKKIPLLETSVITFGELSFCLRLYILISNPKNDCLFPICLLWETGSHLFQVLLRREG